MTDMDKMMIAPCPLCGDSDDFNPSVSASYKYAQPGRARPSLVKAGAYIECDKCGCCGPTKLTEAEAIGAWNQRAYNPDDRLREAATTFLEFWQQEPNGAVTVRAAIRLGSALSPLPQGDG